WKIPFACSSAQEWRALARAHKASDREVERGIPVDHWSSNFQPGMRSWEALGSRRIEARTVVQDLPVSGHHIASGNKHVHLLAPVGLPPPFSVPTPCAGAAQWRFCQLGKGREWFPCDDFGSENHYRLPFVDVRRVLIDECYR